MDRYKQGTYYKAIGLGYETDHAIEANAIAAANTYEDGRVIMILNSGSYHSETQIYPLVGPTHSS